MQKRNKKETRWLSKVKLHKKMYDVSDNEMGFIAC